MADPPRPRFSLGALMGFVALVGVYLAGELRGVIGQPGSISQVYFTLLSCGWLAIYFFYRGVSPWTWVIIASILIQPLIKLGGLEDWTVLSFPAQGGPGLAAMLIGSSPSLVYMLGIAMLLRDVHRRLRADQAEIPSEPQLSPPTLSES